MARPFPLITETLYAGWWGDVPIEESLAKRMQTISDDAIPGFGSSDSSLPSHLFYFRENPAGRSDFLKAVHDSRRELSTKAH